jgi:hypothetical protein
MRARRKERCLRSSGCKADLTQRPAHDRGHQSDFGLAPMRWVTWEDSNFHIPLSKNAFEMSAEFPLFWPKTRRGDFCSCKLWK